VCYPVTLALHVCEISVGSGENLQRLFTMFPEGWPGTGLLVLRIAAALPLLIGGSLEVRGVPHSWGQAAQFIGVIDGVLLLAGLWTPAAGVLKTVIELWVIFSTGDAVVAHLLRAMLGASLVMLGPGAWSVDARLFGRKRIDFRTP
jgi:putative oxidoreductase